jgi:hypothetical protein
MGKTNPPGRNTKNVSANVPLEVFAEMVKLAKESGLERGSKDGTSTYARLALIHAVQTKSLFSRKKAIVVERRESTGGGSPPPTPTASSVAGKTSAWLSDVRPPQPKAP